MDSIQEDTAVEADRRVAQKTRELDDGTSHGRFQPLDKNEHFIGKRQEEYRNQQAAIQKKEVSVLAAQEAEQEKNAEETLAEMKSDSVDQQKMEMMNLATLQQERNFRRHINDKIYEVKNFVEDLDEQFSRTNKVLSMPAEECKKLEPGLKKAAKESLTRFDKILTSITPILHDIQQKLASFEWEGIEMTEIIRNIRTQIFSFREINFCLTVNLLENNDIDPAMTEKFAKSKETLFEKINKMDVLPEHRNRIVEAIRQRQEETMPEVAALSIQN